MAQHEVVCTTLPFFHEKRARIKKRKMNNSVILFVTIALCFVQASWGKSRLEKKKKYLDCKHKYFTYLNC